MLAERTNYEPGISQPGMQRVATLHYTNNGAGNENKRAVMAIEKPDSAKPNPRQRMRKLGLRCKLLKHPLHGGGYSTSPPKYLVNSGSNGIVYTTLLGNQIIAHNLNSDYNDNIICKVKTYHFNDKP